MPLPLPDALPPRRHRRAGIAGRDTPLPGRHHVLSSAGRRTAGNASRPRKPDTGKRIAIVGAGPAGLTAAFYLRRLGHDVTVYDEQAKAGGILRYGIPAYRLPKEVLDKELGLRKKLGVSFVFNQARAKTLRWRP
jgi:NADPH-dependent glutamate synthase beta subunit-like oxidoreductase